MRNCGLWMKADLALIARLGMDGLKLESGLQLKLNWAIKTFIYIPPSVQKQAKNSRFCYHQSTLIV